MSGSSTRATARVGSSMKAGTSQLALLEVSTPTWRLDRRTREIGRRGVASAREALRRASAADEERRDPARAA